MNPISTSFFPLSGPKLKFGTTWLPQRVIRTEDGNERSVICKTHHFRDPRLLEQLPDLFREELLSSNPSEPIRVAVYAGADGSDARSLAVLNALKLGWEQASRFTYESFDLDPLMVQKARQRFVYLNGKERDIFHNMLGIPKRNGCLVPLEEQHFTDKKAYKLADHLANQISSRSGDFFEHAKHPMEEKVILCRNMWDHFTSEQQQTLAKNLYLNMPDDSILVLGSEKVDAGVRKLLRETGFWQVAISGPRSAIFIKVGDVEKDAGKHKSRKFGTTIGQTPVGELLQAFRARLLSPQAQNPLV